MEIPVRIETRPFFYYLVGPTIIICLIWDQTILLLPRWTRPTNHAANIKSLRGYLSLTDQTLRL